VVGFSRFCDRRDGESQGSLARPQRAAWVAAPVAASVGRVKVGRKSTRLIVLRGNSGSGKSSVAAEIRARHGRGIALVGQDNLRRVVLREGDVPGAANIGLIDTVARYALGHGFHVIIDGIIRATTYGAMLGALHHDHQGTSRFYYFDVPFDETMRRHAARPQATEFGREEMSGWYRELDLLPGGIEQVIPAASSLDATVFRIIRDVGLAGQPTAHPSSRAEPGPTESSQSDGVTAQRL
jgi:predicted kinase